MSGRKRGRPRSADIAAVECPRPLHAGSSVKAYGKRTTGRGVRQIYLCRPVGESAHRFSVMTDPNGVLVPLYSPPPKCPVHTDPDWVDDGKVRRVVRDGFYGDGESRRQRYRCYVVSKNADDPAEFHRFTPDLPRQHVHIGETHCDVCREPIGVHRGQQAAARRQSWNLNVVADALVRLAEGDTYVAVSEWAWAKTDRERTRPAALSAKEKARRDKEKTWRKAMREAKKAGQPEPKKPRGISTPFPADPAVRRRRTDGSGNVLPPRKRTARTKAANSRWHTAADWVEMYSPVLWQPFAERLLDQDLAEAKRRARLTPARRAKDGKPHVLLLDDLPVYSSSAFTGGKYGTRRLYNVLAAGRTTYDGVPALTLRLLRAYPTNELAAWSLLLHELGYRPGVYEPEFVVADGATDIRRAVNRLVPSAVFVPSLWHLRNNVELALVENTPGATTISDEGPALRSEIASHLAGLSATTIRETDAKRWKGWWDDLERLLTRLGLSTHAIGNRRNTHEAPMLAALPALRGNPQVPLSTGGYESMLRSRTDAVMTNRSHGFKNLERLNALLDLVVMRDHGVLTNTSKVADLLRASTRDTEGWAAQPREFHDAQPAAGTYASLRDAELMRALAKSKGLI